MVGIGLTDLPKIGAPLVPSVPSSLQIKLIHAVSIVLNFYPPKSCFRIPIQSLESELLFSADISTFYVSNDLQFLKLYLDSEFEIRILKQDLGG